MAIVGDYYESDALVGHYNEVEKGDAWMEISPDVAPEFNRFTRFVDCRVDEPVHPRECDHADVARTVDQQRGVVHERCQAGHAVMLDREGS